MDPTFRRRTGDVDLSVGLTSSGQGDHQWVRQRLMDHHYTIDPTHPYRFHSPKANLSAISYIDLLADPVGSSSSSQQARAAMGVGDGGYLDEPARRLKDLADIAEVTSGLVEAGTHFEIEDIWNQVKTDPEAQDVRRMLMDFGSGESVQWDIENVAEELSRRGFTKTDVDDIIPRRLIEFAEALS